MSGQTERIAGNPKKYRRRTVLGVLLGIGWATATVRVRRLTRGPLRPPGAVEEARFSGLCIRCGNCLRACPTNILVPVLGEYGVASVGTPKIEYQDHYCLETCNQCTLVCPSGALETVDLCSKITRPIGVPVVDMDLCLLGDDRECSLCLTHCPYEAIWFDFSEEFYTLTPRIDLARCPGCGACQVACPTSPEKAIVIRILPRRTRIPRRIEADYL